MLGAGLQVNRSRGEDRFYSSAKARKNQQSDHHHQLQRAQSDVPIGQCKDISSLSRCTEQSEPVSSPTGLAMSNVERFLQAITPSVPAQYPSKSTMRSWRTCYLEFQPHFVLGDLWESFKEWSVYGAGVPLVLNGRDSVIQYYVPYLSAIQIYADPSKLSIKSRRRRASEDSDVDNLSRDSSSDGSSDCERDGSSSAYSIGAHQANSVITCKMQEGFSSSDDSESGSSEVQLLFQYFEHDSPYCRVPLADKISELAVHFPELMNLRSCDVTSSSWLSVAWYPIYRIPTGPTLKDMDACFLTYHTLHTPVEDVQGTHTTTPVISHPAGEEVHDIPNIPLPVFGLASYKLRRSVWTTSGEGGGPDCQLVNSLSQVADNWLRLLQVHHPDHFFFSSR